MCDLRSYNREFVLEFIELYRSYPCLWKIKSKEYMNRQKKNDAYGVLVKKLQEVEEGATKDTVIKKINTLRGGFRREFKKILASHHSGAGEDEVYAPHLWYYENLLFLKDQDQARPSVSNICQDESQDELQEVSSDDEDTEKQTDSQQAVSSPYISAPSPSTSTTSLDVVESRTYGEKKATAAPKFPKGKSKFKKNTTSVADDVLTLVGRKLQCSEENRFTLFGKHVALKIDALSPETRIYTEKLITDILFEAELGNVNRHTKIVTSGNPQLPHNDQQQYGHFQPGYAGGTEQNPNRYGGTTSENPNLAPTSDFRISEFYQTYRPI